LAGATAMGGGMAGFASTTSRSTLDVSGPSVGILDWAGSLGMDIAASGIQEPVLNATLSLTAGTVAVVAGRGLSDSAEKAGGDVLPETLAGTQVLFDGEPAKLLSVAPEELRFQVPWRAATSVHSIQVVHGTASTPTAAAWIYAVAPAQFRDADTYYPIAVNEDGSTHDQDHPARPGSLLSVYFSGGGQVGSPPAPGTAAAELSGTLVGAKLLIGPYDAAPQYTGVAPGILGSWMVQFRIPDIAAGEYSLWIVMDQAKSNRTLINVGEAQ